jgi:hypothetical protein
MIKPVVETFAKGIAIIEQETDRDGDPIIVLNYRDHGAKEVTRLTSFGTRQPFLNILGMMLEFKKNMEEAEAKERAKNTTSPTTTREVSIGEL